MTSKREILCASDVSFELSTIKIRSVVRRKIRAKSYKTDLCGERPLADISAKFDKLGDESDFKQGKFYLQRRWGLGFMGRKYCLPLEN